MNGFRLPDATEAAHVRLQVSDLDQALTFYVEVLGFKKIVDESGAAALSADGAEPPLIWLNERKGAVPKPPRSTGLYHVAIRAATRLELAHLLERLLESEWPLQGMADHLVSEAIYLADPDGNGIELYVDRPKELWPRKGSEISMGTSALDVDSLLRELDRNGHRWLGVDALTTIGHVHLQVSGLAGAERFYHGLLGLDVVSRSFRDALFLSAGGYHHHLGLNVWGTAGAPPPPPSAVGLLSWGLRVPDGDTWVTLLERMRAAGVPVEDWRREKDTVGFLVRDPDKIGLELVVDRARISLDALEGLRAQGAPAHVLD